MFKHHEIIRLAVLVIFLAFFSCTQESGKEKVVVKDPFFGISPSDTPQLLAPELLASAAVEYNGTFSPDGKEFYYTTDVPENAYVTFTYMKPDNTWSEPQIASFSGVYSDYDPLFTPDGSRLYFSSSRPKGDNKDSRIWFVERQNNAWSEPQLVSLLKTDIMEYYSSITNEGVIYFNTWSPSNIYRAQPGDTSYIITKLNEIINDDSYGKGDPFISPQEDYMIYRAYREDSYGRGDLYITFNNDGRWTEPQNLGKPINSEAHEMCPYVMPEQNLFIFASSRQTEKLKTNPLDPIRIVHQKQHSYDNGRLNLYYMSADFIERIRAEQVSSH